MEKRRLNIQTSVCVSLVAFPAALLVLLSEPMDLQNLWVPGTPARRAVLVSALRPVQDSPPHRSLFADALALNAEEKAVLIASTKSPISFLSKLGQTISRKRSPKVSVRRFFLPAANLMTRYRV